MCSFNENFPLCPFCDSEGRWLGERGGRDFWYCPRCEVPFDTPANKDPPDRERDER